MAIFHLQANAVQRSKGRSAVAAAAYRCGEEIADERTGKIHDYSSKRDVVSGFLIGWAGSRESLWNAAEAAEKRKDATTAREYVVALPRELNQEQNENLIKCFAHELFEKYSVAVDVNIHYPDNDNPHAHVMTTTREVEDEGEALGAKSIIDIATRDRKKRGLKGGQKAELLSIKEKWCELANFHLGMLGFGDRIDHRSLKAQGIDREATIKTYGNAERIKVNEAIKQRNAERERIELERAELYLEQHTAEQEQEAEKEARLADLVDSILERNAVEKDKSSDIRMDSKALPEKLKQPETHEEKVARLNSQKSLREKLLAAQKRIDGREKQEEKALAKVVKGNPDRARQDPGL